MARARSPFVMISSTAALAWAVACGPDDPNGGAVPILEPEPAGAPATLPEGRLGCLGSNAPATPSGPNVTLPGWVRTLADPTNAGGAQPAARIEVVDETGLSLGMAFSDTGNGRVAVTVPVPRSGFEGEVVITADGYLEQRFFSSRPYTTTTVAGWAWLLTAEERDAVATGAGVTLAAGTGILTGAVHDCDVFGVANAVVTWDERSDGVVYFDGFTAAPDRTFTAASGRFAIPNVPVGPVAVEAWGRSTPGGPLELLSRADVEVVAGTVTVVDLEPRVGVER